MFDAFASLPIFGLAIPNKVSSIQANAFVGCTNLEVIQIHPTDSQLTAIVAHAFAALPIRDFIIPDKVSSIEADAFRGCIVLENIQVNPSLSQLTTISCFCQFTYSCLYYSR